MSHAVDLTAGSPGVRRRNDSRQSHLVQCIAGRICLHLLNCPPSAYAINLPLIYAIVNTKGLEGKMQICSLPFPADRWNQETL